MRSEAVKRSIDVVGSVVGLVVSAPVMAVEAVLVRLTMGRPVLFRQPRPGRHGEVFTLVKFRTMTGDASQPDEARLTPVGRVLRQTSLDELPELLNVLRGEMSLVGPRPLLPEYLNRYDNQQARRHEVKPGLTGLSQISGRNAQTWEDRLTLDVWYVDHWTVGLDLRILRRTLPHVLRGHGVRAPGSATKEPFGGPLP